MMDRAGFHTLGDFTITAAGTYKPDAGEHLGNLAGIAGATVQLNFRYGSGGTSGKVFLQTSIDQADEGSAPGGTWTDIACFAFTTASESWTFNLSSAAKAVFTPTDGALADDTIIDGVLGDRFRLKIVTIGTYAGQTIVSGRIAAR